MNQFEVLCTDSVVTFYRVLCRILIIMVVSSFAPVCRSLTFIFQNWFQRRALDIRWNFYSGKVEESGSKVHIHTDSIAGASGFDCFWKANDKRHALTFFIHETFVKPTVLAKEEALVGSIDDDGIIQFSCFFQIVQQAAYVLVYSKNGSQIVAHVLLIFPTDQCFAFQVTFAIFGYALCISRVPFVLYFYRHTFVNAI